jgi:serine phosphatase RsbU (regulator of sigma subunit)
VSYRLAAPRSPKVPRQALIAVPLTLIAIVPTVDPFIPPDIHLAPMLYVAPALTATFSRPRITTMTAVLAVGALFIAAVERKTLGTENVIMQICALMALSALLVLFGHLRERHEQELLRIRSVSEATQRVVLRPLPERAGPLRIASEYRTAEADSRIGGDLYAVARTPDSTRLVIGDVRGKGLASIGETAIMLEAFRAAARRQSSLAELVAYLEGSVEWGLAEFSAAEADVGERFVTAVVADIPDDEPVVRLISCGHPPPLLLRQGTVTSLYVPQPIPPLGLGTLADTPDRPATFPFGYGDVLLFYTDGVTEARDGQGTFYPLAERVAAWTTDAPALILGKIIEDLHAHVSDGLNDDLAMIAVQREPRIQAEGGGVPGRP